MVTVGGGYGQNLEDGVYRIDGSGARRQVELYDPETKKWAARTGADGGSWLPRDGAAATGWKVSLSGGDNRHLFEPDGSASQTDTAEIYSPPYLFKGKRPVIKKAPKKADWNESIKVRTAGKPKATSAVLVAPAATTHGNDMNQRLVPLRVKKPKHKKGKRRFNGLQLMTPPSAGSVALPGYYMLLSSTRRASHRSPSGCSSEADGGARQPE